MIYTYNYILLPWCKRWNMTLISQVLEPSIVSKKISALLPGEFPFKVPEANLGAVVVGHRQTPPGSWFHAILHLLWSYESLKDQLTNSYQVVLDSLFPNLVQQNDKVSSFDLLKNLRPRSATISETSVESVFAGEQTLRTESKHQTSHLWR